MNRPDSYWPFEIEVPITWDTQKKNPKDVPLRSIVCRLPTPNWRGSIIYWISWKVTGGVIEALGCPALVWDKCTITDATCPGAHILRI
jgi:hypothetical protein